MATEFTVVVDPDSGAGVDYSSVNAAEAGTQTDLTSAATLVFAHGGITGSLSDNDSVTGKTSGATGTLVHATSGQILIESIASGPFQSGEEIYETDGVNFVTTSDAGDSAIIIGKCRSTGGSADTTAVSIVGSTTSATNYIQYWTDPGETYRHDGTFPTGNQYHFSESATTSPFVIQQNYVRIIGLAIDGAKASGSQHMISILSNLGEGLVISHCIIIRSVAAGNSNFGIRLTGSTDVHDIYNNIFYDISGAIQGAGITDVSGSGANQFIYNNTFHNCDSAVLIDNGALTRLKNNIANDGNDDFLGSFHADSTHNVTDETPDADNAFGATHEDGKTTDATEASKLVDSSETFPNVKVNNIVKNVTDTTFTYVTSIAEAGSGKLGVNDDIFVSGEGYTVYTNIFGSVTFEDEAGDDFHLGAGDTVAKDHGTDLSADGDLAFSDDIDGDTRSGTWDIGADELVAAAPTYIPQSMMVI